MSNYIRNKYLYGPTTSFVSKTQETSNATESKKDENPKSKRNNNTTIPQFDFNSIEEKSRDESIEIFSRFHGLKKSQVVKFIPEFSFNEKRPFRDEITKISNRKLSVLKDKSKIDLITDDLIKLSKILGE